MNFFGFDALNFRILYGFNKENQKSVQNILEKTNSTFCIPSNLLSKIYFKINRRSVKPKYKQIRNKIQEGKKKENMIFEKPIFFPLDFHLNLDRLICLIFISKLNFNQKNKVKNQKKNKKKKGFLIKIDEKTNHLKRIQ